MWMGTLKNDLPFSLKVKHKFTVPGCKSIPNVYLGEGKSADSYINVQSNITHNRIKIDIAKYTLTGKKFTKSSSKCHIC